ncbi:AraC family transcriptional regulator [Piscibacillus halophilus]|uniref:AraC family transcriptional regulator n=1 Tax=Piscibacillus halophilus TaxID=571933 RepID=UPI00240A3C81|nr:AraC family transcriptional regulator [Piscibacillus halophilus]
MDMLNRMNQAIQYIEDHLTDEMDLGEVAKRAYCSEFHFKRMFAFLTGVSLSEYIRRRRLSLAANELLDQNARIIDVAIKYGYQSADAFSRAFKHVHGITPSEVKGQGQSLKAYPRMTVQLKISGGTEMDYRIVEKEAFRVVGIMKRVPIVFEGENPHISAMWQELNEEKIKQLKSLSNLEPKGIIQASTNFSEGRMEEKGGLDHYIGVATDQDGPEGFTALEVPAMTWAVFLSEGPFPETLQETWGRIYSEWFPSSNFEQVNGPEILWNEHPDTSSPHFKSEIWIPVEKSNLHQ